MEKAMNGKRVTAGLAAAAVLLGFSGTGFAQGRGPAVYDYANVLSSQPIVRYVTVKTPVEQCWDDTQTYREYRQPPGAGASTFLGAIIGGVVGHQFGSGSGKDAATVAGSMIGAAIGSDSARRRAGYESGYVEYTRPIRRCETRYEAHQEKRIDGYDVIYRYQGQKYRTQMPYDPGPRLRVRIDVRPAE
jgi:uncharacterized protein YcfJ